MAGKGGKRPGAGRPPGALNKATLQASRIAVREIEQARSSGRELAKEKLEKFLDICEGAAAIFRPSGRDGAIDRPPQDWTLFAEWMDRSIWCAAQLAKYQSPTFKAIMQVMPGQGIEPAAPPSNVIDMQRDPIAIQASYDRFRKAWVVK